MFFKKCIKKYLRESFITIGLAWEVWPLKLVKESLICNGLDFVRVPFPRAGRWMNIGLVFPFASFDHTIYSPEAES